VNRIELYELPAAPGTTPRGTLLVLPGLAVGNFCYAAFRLLHELAAANFCVVTLPRYRDDDETGQIEHIKSVIIDEILMGGMVNREQPLSLLGFGRGNHVAALAAAGLPATTQLRRFFWVTPDSPGAPAIAMLRASKDLPGDALFVHFRRQPAPPEVTDRYRRFFQRARPAAWRTEYVQFPGDSTQLLSDPQTISAFVGAVKKFVPC